VAEGRALRDGVQAAFATGYKRLHIEGDNLIVIEALKGNSATPWQIKYIIQDVHDMLNQVKHAIINHIYREANMVADWLSKYGHSLLGNILAIECCNSEF